MTTAFVRWQTHNLFLDTLAEEAAAAVLPLLTRTSMPLGLTLAHPGETVLMITFPIRSIVSIVNRMRSGVDTEVGLIGREGFFGLQSVLGDGKSAMEAMVQMSDGAYCLPVTDFVGIMKNDSMTQARVLRFAQATIETSAQFAACNGTHRIEERCARWLLMVHDRIQSDGIRLTHDFLSTMLGVRRQGVTLALGALEHAGLIALRRSEIAIVDRVGLEEVACECYESAVTLIERLMGYRLSPTET